MLPTAADFELSTIIYHSAVTVRSLTHCPGMVHFIHAAIYDLDTETCGKKHFKVDLSFPGGTSQVCIAKLNRVTYWRHVYEVRYAIKGLEVYNIQPPVLGRPLSSEGFGK